MKRTFNARITRFSCALFVILTFALSCAIPTLAQMPAGVPPRTVPNAALTKSSQAVEALFSRSDLEGARAAARDAIDLLKIATTTPALAQQVKLDAFFVEMEASALQADTRAELEAALRLCEIRPAPRDARVSIAASRILDLAANTSDFRSAVPRIQNLLGAGQLSARSEVQSDLRAALLAAASDGTPGLSMLDLARQSGLLTEWRIAGPFGTYPNVAFEQSWDPERDGLTRASYGKRIVEQFRFENGEVKLPEYFSMSGVFYGAAQLSVPFAGKWRLRLETPGTAEAWIDNTSILKKDDRFRASAETVGAAVPLRAGIHSVLIKFVPSAAPFRVTLLPPAHETDSEPQSTYHLSPTESSYIRAAQAFWSGDYTTAIDAIGTSGTRFAATDFLLAKVWSRISENGADSTSFLQSTLRLAPSAHAAEYELAAKAFAENRFADAFGAARLVLKANSQFEPAVRLLASSAAKLSWQSEAAIAYERAAALHPSCEILQETSRFFAAASDFTRAQKYESQLSTCAPGSLSYAEALAATGRHAEAAAAARQITLTHPLDRAARELLVRELTLARETDHARVAAHELEKLAPNSTHYRRVAARLDSGDELGMSAGNSEFADEQPFYAPFRRDGLEISKATTTRRFSGGPAVILLNDRVAQLRGDGAASLYVHKLTRVLDGNGIGQYGEVMIPNDAAILELRTIKRDGTIFEPEFNQHKSSISMPALAPGDAVDVEYVLRDLDGGLADNPDAFRFAFGSFAAPIIYSRQTLLAPEDAELNVVPSGDVPSPEVHTDAGQVTRTWELDDVAQSASEVSMPSTGVLPSVQVFASANGGWAGVRDFYRDEFIDAARVGNRVETIAREIPNGTDEQRLRAAYRLVAMRVRRTDTVFESGDVQSAEDTFANFSGNRTAALLALARALDIPGDVLMSRNIGAQPPGVASAQVYKHPLLVFHLKANNGSRRDIVLDAEAEGIGFGGIAASIERKDALLVPLDQPATGQLFTAVPAPILDEHSVADGEVSFDSEGTLTAHLTIRMGAARGAQMRAMLSGIDAGDRKHFFEQLASRIFPGTTEANGRVENETDTDNRLTLIVDCRAAHFTDVVGATEIDQLVPALGLRGMYATGGSRNTPLYIETPLLETSAFRIHLPDGIAFAQPPRNFVEQGEFGSYSVGFTKLSQNTLEVRRDFNIPAQIIETRRFESFARFARNVEDAEQLRLGLQRTSTVALRTSQN